NQAVDSSGTVIFDSGVTNDFINNVENVYLAPNLGTNYSITVVGRRVNVNAVMPNTNNVAQDYALVISSGNTLLTNVFTINPAVLSVNTNPVLTFLNSSTNLNTNF